MTPPNRSWRTKSEKTVRIFPNRQVRLWVVGRVAATHLAAACGTPNLAHGLATGRFLAHDLAPDPLVVSGGMAQLPDAPGLGVVRIDS
ncbi:MAG: hypothetical protein IID15_08590 [Candidatus Marinimicrobia bacterium]|nr:hypothetical protein [Candidatus Neomarinimicrobiota bacterium]